MTITPVRLKDPDGRSTEAEATEARKVLGQLQWLAVLTQVMIMARVSLLMSEIKPGCDMAKLKEVQEIVCELRRSTTTTLKIHNMGYVPWQQVSVVMFADASWANREDGSSTGGLLGGFTCMEAEDGATVPISLARWRSWKLERVARSSNEAEIQSMTVGEDAAFTLRLLWGEINGAGVKTGFPLSPRAQYVVDMVKSVTATDSKGVFDAINNNESSDLGPVSYTHLTLPTNREV